MKSLGQIAATTGLELEALKSLAGAAHRLYRVKPQVKESGGIRIIEAPFPHLKKIQKALVSKLLNAVPVDESVHGKVGTSQISAARVHISQPMIVTMDIRSFFPSVTAKMVNNSLVNSGFDFDAAQLLTKICTRSRRLPQGAPTSPVLAQIVVTPILTRIRNLLADISGHCKMSLYVDDLTISGPVGIQRLIPTIIKIWKSEGFEIHPGKTKVMANLEIQEVLGVWVTDRLRPTSAFMTRLAHVKKTLPVNHPTRKGMENWVRMITNSN